MYGRSSAESVRSLGVKETSQLSYFMEKSPQEELKPYLYQQTFGLDGPLSRARSVLQF
jgi:hypothetical protein